MKFVDIHKQYNFYEVALAISGEDAFRFATNRGVLPSLYGASPKESPLMFTEHDVQDALQTDAGRLTDENLMALLSPVAQPFLEAMAQKAQKITRQRFGNVIGLYAPLYLSNECRSACTYCGFSSENSIARVTLTLEQSLAEADILYKRGIRHILLLTGEDYRAAPLTYIADAARHLKDKFSSVSIEVYPLKEDDYRKLRISGVDGLTIYQETYDPVRYSEVHLKGVKQKMEFRLDCPDRAGAAGMRRIGIGALLGLSDPAGDVFFTALHARHLMHEYWQTQISISLPRLKPANGLKQLPLLPDPLFVQYLCALRIFLPDAAIYLSTRESKTMRDSLAQICVTSMSAGSRTDPGGYQGLQADEQFHIEDNRSVDEIVEALCAGGLEPLFTDWSFVLK